MYLKKEKRRRKEKRNRKLYLNLYAMISKITKKNPRVYSMLLFVGDIKKIICMSSEKISKNLKTGCVCVNENQVAEIQRKRENLFYCSTSYIV